LVKGRERMLDAMAIRGPQWFVIAALVTMAPDTPGVFELWEDDELVFVGSSASIIGRRGSTRAAEPLP
jgi:hypothetical protein